MAEAKKTTKLIVDLRAMDETQLAQKIADMKKELVEQHRANHASELPSPAVIRKNRRSIAQAMTVLTQKHAAAAQTAKETK